MFNNQPHFKKRRLFFVPVVLAAFFILGALVQIIWNAVLPNITHAPYITYWQAAALLLLCRILFGRYNFGRGGRPGFGGPPGHMKDKWMSMDAEERLRFKQEWRERGKPRHGH